MIYVSANIARMTDEQRPKRGGWRHASASRSLSAWRMSWPASSVTEKVPPNPQHSSNRSKSTNSMPSHFAADLSASKTLVVDTLTHRLQEQAANRRATRVQCNLVRECGPGKLLGFYHVVKKFHEIVGVRLDVIPLRAGRRSNEFVPYMMCTTARGDNAPECPAEADLRPAG
jgi:hypothetical protein